MALNELATNLTIKHGTKHPDAQAGDRIVEIADDTENQGVILYRAMDATRPHRYFVRWRWNRRSGSLHLSTNGDEDEVVSHVCDMLFGRRRWDITADKRKVGKKR